MDFKETMSDLALIAALEGNYKALDELEKFIKTVEFFDALYCVVEEYAEASDRLISNASNLNDAAKNIAETIKSLEELGCPSGLETKYRDFLNSYKEFISCTERGILNFIDIATYFEKSVTKLKELVSAARKKAYETSGNLKMELLGDCRGFLH